MYTSLLLTASLLAPAFGHTLPRHPHAHRAASEAAAKRGIPKAHLGFPPSNPNSIEFPPSNPNSIEAVAGFKREMDERSIPKAHLGFAPHDPETIKGVAGFKRDGQKLVRRKKSKRACAVQQQPVGIPSATSSIGDNLHAHPTPSSSAYAVPSASSTWSEAAQPAISSASAVSSPAWSEPSASTTSSASAPDNTSPVTGGLSGLMGFIFPRGKGSADWTTVVDQAGSMSFNGALKPLSAGKLPQAGNAPDGSYALVANYPANSVKLASPGHGYSFYSSGDKNGVSVTGAKEVMFSYSVYFPEGFQFVKGGKLPGLYGGTSAETAKSCSGGRQDDRDSCFSARLMWRKDGMGEIYNYLPTQAYSNQNYCNYPPYSLCDAKFGESIGRGAFTWATGQWTTVAIRLKLNDAGVANGEQELFVNGQSTISLTNLEISVNPETKIYGIMAQTFFGGSDQSWASPVDQSAYFKDWSMAVLA